MMRRTLANMASFYTEQQSVDVREGLSRRVQEGWFVGKAPYGYRTVRKDGRSLVEFDSATADNVRRVSDENFSRMSRSRWMASSNGYTAKAGPSARRCPSSPAVRFTTSCTTER